MSAVEMLDLLRNRRRGYSLDGAFYNDPGFYALDLEEIFGRQWIFACMASEITRSGDYHTLTIGATPVLVIRGKDGAIRAFFNTCRHRGFKLCEDAHGHADRVTCPYHLWSYDLTGRLVGAGRMHDGLDFSELSLRPIATELVGGAVYVCLSEDPPDISAFRKELEPFVEPHGLAETKLACEMRLIAHSNWKLVMENSRECYHCSPRHPSLMNTFLDRFSAAEAADDPFVAGYWQRCEAMGLKSGIVLRPGFGISRLPFTRGAVSITMDGKPACNKLLGNLADGDVGSARWVHFPSTFNHALGDYSFHVRMLPVGPDRTEICAKWLVHRDAVEGEDYDLARLIKVWDQTNEEDLALCERNQAGVRSVGYRPGPYSKVMERGVIAFVEWYSETMLAALEARPGMAPSVHRKEVMSVGA